MNWTNYKEVKKILESFYFEINDELTRQQITKHILEYYNNNSFKDVTVQCDKENNTPRAIDNHELDCYVNYTDGEDQITHEYHVFRSGDISFIEKCED